MAEIEIVEELKATYAKADDNKADDNREVTFTYGIQRIKTDVVIQNEVGGGQNAFGQEPTNNDKDKFALLQKMFLSEVSYCKAHGTIYGIDGNDWRIDQQGNHENLHNIQFQVVEKTFANVVVNTIIKAANQNIHMDMRVFAKHQGMKKEHSFPVHTVYNVNQLDGYREEKSKINLSQRINQYVGEALGDSLYTKRKYEINIILLEQTI